jgi:hypothetical protein
MQQRSPERTFVHDKHLRPRQSLIGADRAGRTIAYVLPPAAAREPTAVARSHRAAGVGRVRRRGSDREVADLADARFGYGRTARSQRRSEVDDRRNPEASQQVRVLVRTTFPSRIQRLASLISSRLSPRKCRGKTRTRTGYGAPTLATAASGAKRKSRRDFPVDDFAEVFVGVPGGRGARVAERAHVAVIVLVLGMRGVVGCG